MSSWFSSLENATEALNKIGESISDTILPINSDDLPDIPDLPSFETASKTLGSLSTKVNDLSTKVSDALPINNELINKLTLRSDELVKEHELLDAQEKRKELVREYLSELLPWETKEDESLDILMEECKSAILNLSKTKETFESPFRLEKGEMFNVDKYTEVSFENINEQEGEGDEGGKDDNNGDADVNVEMTPDQKLEKMLPLPLLLEHFDIDTHVGLIERVLKADENLVQMHSMLSGAGEKETLFWKNYFFHCAYTRYQKGLSIDEIWSSKPKASITNEMTSTAIMNANNETTTLNDIIDDDGNNINDNDDDAIELDFEDELNSDDMDLMINSENVTESLLTKKQSFDSGLNRTKSNDGGVGDVAVSTSIGKKDKQSSSQSDSASEYEIVNEAIANIDDTDNLDDLDDLEAEIARELGED